MYIHMLLFVNLIIELKLQSAKKRGKLISLGQHNGK